MRTILTPAAVPDAALDELKSWLAISTTGNDTTLSALIGSALQICEGFTGQMLLEADCEEILPARPGRWLALSTRPVQAVVSAEGIPAEGARFALASSAYALELDADGSARFRLIRQGAAGRVAIGFTAGLASEWSDLPEALRHGVIRLAAYLYRERDNGDRGAPPAAVAALWRPWRRQRLL